jgi:hypothetical protein
MIIATRNVLVVPVSPKQSLFLLAAKEGALVSAYVSIYIIRTAFGLRKLEQSTLWCY